MKIPPFDSLVWGSLRLAPNTHNYYMPGTTTKLSKPFSSSGAVITLEIFFLGLGLTVTEITIKKVQKQDLKSIVKKM